MNAGKSPEPEAEKSLLVLSKNLYWLLFSLRNMRTVQQSKRGNNYVDDTSL